MAAAACSNKYNHNISSYHRVCTSSSDNQQSSSSLSNLLVRCCRSRPSSKVCPQQNSSDADQIWSEIRQEAESDMKQDPLLLSNLYRTAILSHATLETALANHLALKLCTPHVSTDALAAAFHKAFSEDAGIGRAVRLDLMAARERDPACLTYVHCFLNFKGFLACQAHRMAHHFWINGRTAAALLIQNRVAEVFAVDIHPRAEIGSGLVIDHATGVVIGETAVVGNNVTILHSVTLGGTGKAAGDRHPKIGDGVMIGAGAKVLGNIKVGRNARIGAGAVVLKEVPADATAVGNPARLLEKSINNY